MRKTMSLISAATALLLGSAAHGSATSGTVSYVYAMPDGQILFNVSGSRPQPACATTPNRWAFNGATLAGQAKLSVLMTAYAQNKTIYVDGAGTCDVWGDTESVNWLRTQDS